MLRDLLGESHQVEARDRITDERGDDVDLAGGSDLPFDQIWMFAVDATNALTAADIAGIEAFRRRGGGLLLTRDHFDLGSGLSKLSGIGAAHHFHNVNPETEPERRTRDETFPTQAALANYSQPKTATIRRSKRSRPSIRCCAGRTAERFVTCQRILTKAQ